MTIDFKLENDEIKSLSVVKKQNTANHYQCIDEDNFCWMEVEISIPNIEIISKDDRIKDEDDITAENLGGKTAKPTRHHDINDSVILAVI